jgi:lactoylglutathione lyase
LRKVRLGHDAVASNPQELLIAELAYSMIRVLEEARSLEFYRRAFGFTVAERVPFNGFTLIYLRGAASDFELELTINQDRSAPYALGDGYGHLAVVIPDLAAEHGRMATAGLQPGQIHEMRHGGEAFARFFFVTDADGYRIEVLERFGRFR